MWHGIWNRQSGGFYVRTTNHNWLGPLHFWAMAILVMYVYTPRLMHDLWFPAVRSDCCDYWFPTASKKQVSGRSLQIRTLQRNPAKVFLMQKKWKPKNSFNNDPNDTRQELPTRLPPFTIDEMVVNDGLFLPTVSLDLKGTSKPDNHDFHTSSHQIWFSRFLYRLSRNVICLHRWQGRQKRSSDVAATRSIWNTSTKKSSWSSRSLARPGCAEPAERRCHKGRSPWNPS